MESCPACRNATISSWRRWFTKESDSFQCSSCKTWIALRDSKGSVKRFKHPNVALFVLIPFGTLGATLAIILVAKQLPKPVSFALALALLGAMLVSGLRKISRSQYVVIESQRPSGLVQVVRSAWGEPDFRAWLGKLMLFTLEMFGLLALLPALVRFAENAL